MLIAYVLRFPCIFSRHYSENALQHVEQIFVFLHTGPVGKHNIDKMSAMHYINLFIAPVYFSRQFIPLRPVHIDVCQSRTTEVGPTSFIEQT